jgi:hypothetical protein
VGICSTPLEHDRLNFHHVYIVTSTVQKRTFTFTGNVFLFFYFFLLFKSSSFNINEDT